MLKVGKIINEVRMTKEYIHYVVIRGGRIINRPHVERLKVKILSDNRLMDNPIVAMWNPGLRKYEIIDGQHRFTAAQELGLPFAYIVAKSGTYTVQDIAAMNDEQKPWTTKDHLGSNIAQGRKDYQALVLFSDATRLPLMTSAALLEVGTAHNVTPTRENFVKGLFSVRTPAKAEAVRDLMDACRDAGVDHYRHTPFVKALARCMDVEGFSVEQFKAKLKHSAPMLRKCQSQPQNIAEIERFYNYRCHGPILALAAILAEQHRQSRMEILAQARATRRAPGK